MARFQLVCVSPCNVNGVPFKPGDVFFTADFADEKTQRAAAARLGWSAFRFQEAAPAIDQEKEALRQELAAIKQFTIADILTTTPTDDLKALGLTDKQVETILEKAAAFLAAKKTAN
jgi:hypothetical protein